MTSTTPQINDTSNNPTAAAAAAAADGETAGETTPLVRVVVENNTTDNPPPENRRKDSPPDQPQPDNSNDHDPKSWPGWTKVVAGVGAVTAGGVVVKIAADKINGNTSITKDDFKKFVRDQQLVTQCPHELHMFLKECEEKTDCGSKVNVKLYDVRCFSYTDDEKMSAWVAVNPNNKGGRFITFRKQVDQHLQADGLRLTKFNVFDDMTFEDVPDNGTGFNCKWTSKSNFHRFDYQAEVANDATSVWNVTDKGGDLKKYVAEAKKIEREGGN